MKKRYSQVSQIPSKAVFFDANILIYIFWPTGQPNWEKSYSRMFSEINKKNIEKYIDFIVVSEVINSLLRIEYNKYLQQNEWKKNDFRFKIYRDSKDGKLAINDIYSVVKRHILQQFKIIGKIFRKDDILNFLTIDKIDFSDKAIVSLCKENDCILLTNDKDFINEDVEILTSNPILLKNKSY